MKKLTLNQAWQLCLKQWKWMIAQRKKGSKANVETLKRKWFRLEMPEHKGKIRHNCYFCEYDKQKEDTCRFCPARGVDIAFDCIAFTYQFSKHPEDFLTFSKHPEDFLAKLLELDKKRKSKKVATN